MQHLNLTRPTPAENLALDEALLDAAEAGEIAGGVLRLWEMPCFCVVLGRSSQADREVNLAACREAEVPVLRRSSGGGPVVAGPGCLMYSIVLDYRKHAPHRAIDLIHCTVLEHIATMLAPMQSNISLAGTSDLVVNTSAAGGSRFETLFQRKISGNSLRMKREHFLYHGTLLYDFELDRIGRLLDTPIREPDYRAGRAHAEFVANSRLARAELEQAFIAGWEAHESLSSWPQQRMADLVRTRYGADPAWLIYDPGDSSSRG